MDPFELLAGMIFAVSAIGLIALIGIMIGAVVLAAWQAFVEWRETFEDRE